MEEKESNNRKYPKSYFRFFEEYDSNSLIDSIEDSESEYILSKRGTHEGLSRAYKWLYIIHIDMIYTTIVCRVVYIDNKKCPKYEGNTSEKKGKHNSMKKL
jgi:hypothetical protein